MGIPKVILGVFGLLAGLVVAVVSLFASEVSTLPLNVYERGLLIPPELEVLYRQVDYEAGVDWAILAAWDGAANGFDLPVPSAADLYAEKVQEVIDQEMEEAEEYCEEHPEDEINCPPGPVVLDPEELLQLWGAAYAQWRVLLKQHVMNHVTAITPHISAFWKEPEAIYRLFLPTEKAGLAAELLEGYLILDEVPVADDDEILVPVPTSPVDWEPTDGFAWPAIGPITSRFGMRYSPIDGQLRLHGGIDMGLDSGTPVMASRSGTVLEASYSPVYGRYVVISHGGGYRTLYAHNAALAVSVGETVSQGEVVAYSGNTGASTGPHLHFEILYQGQPVDPLLFLTERVMDLGA